MKGKHIRWRNSRLQIGKEKKKNETGPPDSVKEKEKLKTRCSMSK